MRVRQRGNDARVLAEQSRRSEQQAEASRASQSERAKGTFAARLNESTFEPAQTEAPKKEKGQSPFTQPPPTLDPKSISLNEEGHLVAVKGAKLPSGIPGMGKLSVDPRTGVIRTDAGWPPGTRIDLPGTGQFYLLDDKSLQVATEPLQKGEKLVVPGQGWWEGDKKGFPKGTAQIVDGKAYIPGMGLIDATKTQKLPIGKNEFFKLRVNQDGTVTSYIRKEGGGIFGGTIGKIISGVLTVASFVPGVNLVAVPLNVAWSAAQAAYSFAKGNILGGIAGVAGAVAGGAGSFLRLGGAALSAGAAATLQTVGRVAQSVSNVAGGVQTVMAGIKGKDFGAILGGAAAIVSGAAGGVRSLASSAGSALFSAANRMEQLSSTLRAGASVANGVQAFRGGNPLAGIGALGEAASELGGVAGNRNLVDLGRGVSSAAAMASGIRNRDLGGAFSGAQSLYETFQGVRGRMAEETSRRAYEQYRAGERAGFSTARQLGLVDGFDAESPIQLAAADGDVANDAGFAVGRGSRARMAVMSAQAQERAAEIEAYRLGERNATELPDGSMLVGRIRVDPVEAEQVRRGAVERAVTQSRPLLDTAAENLQAFRRMGFGEDSLQYLDRATVDLARAMGVRTSASEIDSKRDELIRVLGITSSAVAANRAQNAAFHDAVGTGLKVVEQTALTTLNIFAPKPLSAAANLAVESIHASKESKSWGELLQRVALSTGKAVLGAIDVKGGLLKDGTAGWTGLAANVGLEAAKGTLSFTDKLRELTASNLPREEKLRAARELAQIEAVKTFARMAGTEVSNWSETFARNPRAAVFISNGYEEIIDRAFGLAEPRLQQAGAR
ncbi:MAG: hypothetical protein HYZ28_00600 [Myxococcales bacterium]|nr:hypothetical protein [Myxococcales bacterium]